MKKVGEKEGFHFHDRCASLKLNHLAFADDVLLFCHGEFMSILYMLQALKTFSLTSGLYPNATKTALYCCNMKTAELNRIIQISGFSRQEMPFTYLGIPICGKKISGKECDILAERMTARIKTWSSRNLSFAGRITLINSVLIAIQAYWSQIMILPKKVLRSIEAICRAFLWKGNSMFQGAGSVAWHSICQPKAGGGLGIKDLETWNKAAISKYVWAISNKQESLWLKWVHSVYIKSQSWETYSPSIHSSWYWKKMVALKDHIRDKVDFDSFHKQKYHVAAGYKMFSLPITRLHWSKEAWSRLNIPKHSVIVWLAMLNRLKTQDRLLKFGMQVQGTCCLCEMEPETCKHLFFECSVAEQCLQVLKLWLNWFVQTSSLQQLLKWVGKSKLSKFKKGVYTAAIVGLVYNIWKSRNEIIWQNGRVNPTRIVEETKWNIKARIERVMPKKVKPKDREWFLLL
ncbi:hypothetical protein CsatB_019546 [Cannabis sativa]